MISVRSNAFIMQKHHSQKRGKYFFINNRRSNQFAATNIKDSACSTIPRLNNARKSEVLLKKETDLKAEQNEKERKAQYWYRTSFPCIY